MNDAPLGEDGITYNIVHGHDPARSRRAKIRRDNAAYASFLRSVDERFLIDERKDRRDYNVDTLETGFDLFRALGDVTDPQFRTGLDELFDDRFGSRRLPNQDS